MARPTRNAAGARHATSAGNSSSSARSSRSPSRRRTARTSASSRSAAAARKSSRKGVLRGVVGFAKKHPVSTAGIAAGALAGGYFLLRRKRRGTSAPASTRSAGPRGRRRAAKSAGRSAN
jgi:hypothetical protein